MSSSLSAFLCPFVALVYPGYASYKAVMTPQPDDDTQWLTYWIITAIFHVCELFSDRILHWLPLYYEFKLICLLVLQNTSWKIPTIIFHRFLQPILQPNEPAIDEWLSRSWLNMMVGITNGLHYCLQNGPSIIATITAAIHAAANAAEKTAREEHDKKLTRKNSAQPVQAKT